MRFCPFCSAENPDEASHCATCARRLPPLPPRRQRSGQTPPPVLTPPAPAPAGLPMPGTAALRRAALVAEPRDPEGPARRKSDSFQQELVTPLPPPPQRTRPPSMPPPPPPPIGRNPTATPMPIRDATSVDPPPTRIARAQEMADRPFTPPKVLPIPEVPEPGLLNAVRYSTTFLRARWQRRGAIRELGEEINQDTAALDLVLGTLGHQARQLKLDNRAVASENAAIDACEERKTKLDQANAELGSRKNDETAKFAEVERDWLTKVGDAEKLLDEANRELSSLEAQRRSLRDKRKEVERRQKAYLKAAEDRDTEAGNAQMGDSRSELRRAAESHRKEAAGLEPERQDLDRRLSALERPLSQAQARVDAARADLESARRSLHDAREGHRHRLAEIEAEQGRKTREVALADAEIQRRLVTLGTLINLNRIDHPGFVDLYARIDRLRMAIGARTTEIDKLTAEREAYDKGSLVRGFVTLGGGVVLMITLIVILLALL